MFIAIYRLAYVPEDKDFMLELNDFSIDAIGDKLLEEEVSVQIYLNRQ